MDVWFLSGSNDDVPTRQAIVRALGSEATVISASLSNALSGGLGRPDIVILPLRTFSADDQTSIEILRRQLGCPVLCISQGPVPEGFATVVPSVTMVDSSQPQNWKQLILDQVLRRPALSMA